jgi:hypothetical protein
MELDIMYVRPPTRRGHKYILTVGEKTDEKRVHFVPLKWKTSQDISFAFKAICLRRGSWPTTLASDNGKELISLGMQGILRQHDTLPLEGTDYVHEGQATVEVNNKVGQRTARSIMLHAYAPCEVWPEAFETADMWINLARSGRTYEMPEMEDQIQGANPKVLIKFGHKVSYHIPKELQKTGQKMELREALGYLIGFNRWAAHIQYKVYTMQGLVIGVDQVRLVPGSFKQDRMWLDKDVGHLFKPMNSHADVFKFVELPHLNGGLHLITCSSPEETNTPASIAVDVDQDTIAVAGVMQTGTAETALTEGGTMSKSLGGFEESATFETARFNDPEISAFFNNDAHLFSGALRKTNTLGTRSSEYSFSCTPPKVSKVYPLPARFNFDRDGVYRRIPETMKHALESESADRWVESTLREAESILTICGEITEDQDEIRRNQVIRSKLIFALKSESGNEKTRWCGLGFMQGAVALVDRSSPTIYLTALKMLWSIGIKNGWKFKKSDYSTAFLWASLFKPVYSFMPKGLSDAILTLPRSERRKLKYLPVEWHELSDELLKQKIDTCVVRLRNAIYGLTVSAQRWWLTLIAGLKRLGFTTMRSDPCLLVYKRDGKIIGMIAIHVDDITATGSAEDVDMIIDKVSSLFPSTVDEYKEFLGLEIKHDEVKGDLLITHNKYITKLAKKANIDNGKKADTPGVVGGSLDSTTLDPKTGELMSTKPGKHALSRTLVGKAITEAQGYIGSLMYSSIMIRPDISFDTKECARFNNAPSEAVRKAAIRIIRYLNGTKDLGLLYTKAATLREDTAGLVVLVDASWGRRSTSGVLIFHYGHLVYHSSTTQKVTALSTMEAELYALKEGLKVAVYLYHLLNELDMGNNKPMRIYCDNESAIDVIYSSTMSTRARHIAIWIGFLRDVVKAVNAEVHHIGTHENTSDVMTKTVALVKHRKFRLQSMGYEPLELPKGTY